MPGTQDPDLIKATEIFLIPRRLTNVHGHVRREWLG